MKHAVIELNGLSIIGLHNEKLNAVDLILRESECISLASASWQKETLVDFFSGRAEKIQGKIKIDGKILNLTEKKDFQKNNVYVVDSIPVFLDSLDVSENFFILRKNSLKKVIINKQAIRLQTDYYLEKYRIPFKSNAKGTDLSVVDKLYVTMLRYISQGARVLCLNEVSTLFSNKQFNSFLDFLRQIKLEGIALIISDNYPELFFPITEQVVLLRHNSIIMKLYDKNRFEQGMRELQKEVEIFTRKKQAYKSGHYFLKISGTIGTQKKYRIEANAGEIVGITAAPDYLHPLWSAFVDFFPEKPQIVLNDKVLNFRTLDELIRDKIVFFDLATSKKSVFRGLSKQENILLPSYPRISKGIFLNKEGNEFIFSRDKFLMDNDEMSLQRISSADNYWKAVLLRWKLFNPKVFFLYNVISILNIESRELVKKELLAMAERGTTIIQLENSPEYCEDFADRIEGLS